jgi:hypothetical protein
MRARGLWEVHLVTAIRLWLICSVAFSFMLVAPAARAQSDGVPTIAGAWSGKVTSVFWDQTNAGPPKPRNKYKSKVDVTITQGADGAIEMTLTFDDPFPVDTGTVQTTLTLTGFVGNYHLSAGEESTLTLPAVTLSGSSNKKAKNLSLTGVAASGEFTHELKIKLKRLSP